MIPGGPARRQTGVQPGRPARLRAAASLRRAAQRGSDSAAYVKLSA